MDIMCTSKKHYHAWDSSIQASDEVLTPSNRTKTEVRRELAPTPMSLHKELDEILEAYRLDYHFSQGGSVLQTDQLPIPKRFNKDEATQALSTLIDRENKKAEQKPVGDAIEIKVAPETMKFVMSKIKLQLNTIAKRTLTPQWVVEKWSNGKGDQYDYEVYIWKLKILASLAHFNWAVFLLKPENLPDHFAPNKLQSTKEKLQ